MHSFLCLINCPTCSLHTKICCVPVSLFSIVSSEYGYYNFFLKYKQLKHIRLLTSFTQIAVVFVSYTCTNTYRNCFCVFIFKKGCVFFLYPRQILFIFSHSVSPTLFFYETFPYLELMYYHYVCLCCLETEYSSKCVKEGRFTAQCVGVDSSRIKVYCRMVMVLHMLNFRHR